MPVAFIVLAYRLPEQVTQLLSALEHSRARLYLHLDRRVPAEPFERALRTEGLSDITLLPRHATPHGGIGIVDAVLEGVAAGVADGCSYYIYITGQDFPLRPVAELIDFFDAAGDRSYIEHWAIEKSVHRFGGRDRTDFYAYDWFGRRETCIPFGEDTSFLSTRGRALNWALRVRSLGKPPRRFPPYVRPYAGDAGWSISRAAADHVLNFVREHPDYGDYHRYTAAPDEVFFHSILAGTDFADRHDLVNEARRFYVWHGIHGSTLTLEDLPAMEESGAFFARKVDAGVDDRVLAALAARL